MKRTSVLLISVVLILILTIIAILAYHKTTKSRPVYVGGAKPLDPAYYPEDEKTEGNMMKKNEEETMEMEMELASPTPTEATESAEVSPSI